MFWWFCIFLFYLFLSVGYVFFSLFHFRTPETPVELAIDFILHDFEMAGKFRRILIRHRCFREKQKKLFKFVLMIL